MIDSWLFYGLLEDPFQEFFIVLNTDLESESNTDTMWTSHFQYLSQSVPSFMSEETSRMVTRVICCDQSKPLFLFLDFHRWQVALVYLQNVSTYYDGARPRGLLEQV